MELILNLVWVLVGIALVCWSLMHSRGTDRLGGRSIALAMLLVILFPAISITDDLWAAHNPAESDILVRRYDDAGHHHGTVPHLPTAFLSSRFQPPYILVVGDPVLPRQESIGHEAIAPFSYFIRPPPVL